MHKVIGVSMNTHTGPNRVRVGKFSLGIQAVPFFGV